MCFSQHDRVNDKSITKIDDVVVLVECLVIGFGELTILELRRGRNLHIVGSGVVSADNTQCGDLARIIAPAVI